MMKNNNGRPAPKEYEKKARGDIDYLDSIFELNSVASATAFTGLIPSQPLSDEDMESYSDIYGVPVPEELAGDDVPPSKGAGRYFQS